MIPKLFLNFFLISCLIFILFSLFFVLAAAKSNEETNFGTGVKNSITVLTDPPGATIYLDNTLLTKKSNGLIMNIQEGTHTIKLTLPGYYDFEKMIDVYPYGTTYIEHTFEKKENSLRIVSNPKGAEIFIDGIYKGKTDLSLVLEVGKQYSIRLILPGYYSFEKTINLQERVQRDIEGIYHDFSPLPENGTLNIRSIPDGAEISLDGISVGTTNKILNTVKPGIHTITLRKYGFDDYFVSFQTSVEKQEELNITLRPQDGILNIDSHPVKGKTYIDGSYVGDTPYTGKSTQGKHRVEIKSIAFEDSVSDIDIDFQGRAIIVELTPLAVSEISVAEKKIAENQKFEISRAKSFFEQAKQQLQAEDYLNAYESAQKAGKFADDIDEDGIPNRWDFEPGVANNYLYLLPFLILLGLGSAFFFDWRRCRINPDIEIRIEDVYSGKDTLILIKPIIDNQFSNIFCTIYLDNTFFDMVDITGDYRANLGTLMPGKHSVTVELLVKQKRYGKAEIVKTIGFNVK